jgi:DNA-binding MarR family transcriptional regulator
MPQRRPTSEASPCFATAMRKASRRLTQLYDEALAPSGLRSTQYAILGELERRSKEAPTVQELASALVIDRSALGHNLRPLERDGLLALHEGTEDRRRRHVVISPEGRQRLRDAKLLWQMAQDRFHEVFGELDAARLRTTLLGIAHDERLAALKD